MRKLVFYWNKLTFNLWGWSYQATLKLETKGHLRLSKISRAMTRVFVAGQNFSRKINLDGALDFWGVPEDKR